MSSFVLSLSCPDQRGIVAVVSQQLAALGCNIVRNSQFGDKASGTFCMRTQFETQQTPLSEAELQHSFAEITHDLHALLSIRSAAHNRRALVMVSRFDHCLVDLLYRISTGELALDLPAILSNHGELRPLADRANIPFVEIDARNPELTDQTIRKFVADYAIDFVILARYMQIVSSQLCDDFAGRIINIHHSFLPGFKGADPYTRAWRRGVKVIGATAHYVTANLDEGPIICQQTEPVSHLDNPRAMKIKGRDIERRVLAEAVAAHSEDRVFTVGARESARTIVFPR